MNIRQLIQTILSEGDFLNNLTPEERAQYLKGMSKHLTKKQFNSFAQIQDEDIPVIIGQLEPMEDEYRSDEEIITDLQERLNLYRNLPDPVTMYRIIGVEGKHLIDKKELGRHYVLDMWQFDDDFLRRIDFDILMDNNLKIKPYIAEVQVSLNDIDVMTTLQKNILFPVENEITLRKGVKPIIKKITKLK